MEKSVSHDGQLSQVGQEKYGIRAITDPRYFAEVPNVLPGVEGERIPVLGYNFYGIKGCLVDQNGRKRPVVKR